MFNVEEPLPSQFLEHNCFFLLALRRRIHSFRNHKFLALPSLLVSSVATATLLYTLMTGCTNDTSILAKRK